MIYNYSTTKENFVSDYVQVASMGELTKLEFKVIVGLIKVYLEVKDSENPWEYVFSSITYNKLYEELELSKKTNFYKIITTLKAKKVIKEVDKVLTISRILIPIDDTFGIKFVLQ